MPDMAKCRQWLEKNFPNEFAKLTVGKYSFVTFGAWNFFLNPVLVCLGNHCIKSSGIFWVAKGKLHFVKKKIPIAKLNLLNGNNSQ